ncbi:hypothetical protein FKM82_028309 [Ascaphus truei]
MSPLPTSAPLCQRRGHPAQNLRTRHCLAPTKHFLLHSYLFPLPLSLPLTPQGHCWAGVGGCWGEGHAPLPGFWGDPVIFVGS